MNRHLSHNSAINSTCWASLGAFLLLVGCAGGGEEETAQDPAQSPPPASSAAPASAAAAAEVSSTGALGKLTLAELRQQAASSDPKVRRALARTLRKARADDAHRLHQWLHREVEIAPVDFKNVLLHLGAAVPDSNGRFGKPARVADLDWLEALTSLDRDAIAAGLRPAAVDALLTVALIRALANTDHPEAALSLVRFGYRHGGAFRDECGRQVRTMGVHAVPGLVRAKAIKDPQAYKMVRYAAYQLDRMNLTRPLLAVKRADPNLLVDLLHAYGEVRESAAVDVVLTFCDHDNLQVRRAARWAMLRYVSGRPPRAKKRKLKLTGGRRTERERTLYWTYRQLATRALSTALAEIKVPGGGEHREEVRRRLVDEVEPRTMAERLFAHQEKQRAQRRTLSYQKALALAKKGKLDTALGRFDEFLTDDPFMEQRAEMAAYYFRRGTQLQDQGGQAAGARLMVKALHLNPRAAFAREARARLLVAEALASDATLSEKRWKLQRALHLAPELKPAQQALAGFEGKRKQRVFIAGGVGGGTLLFLALGLTLVWRRKQRR